MSKHYLKDMWEALKNLGKFQEFSSYEEYRQKTWGQNIEKEKFVSTLEGREKADFLEMFGEEDG